MNFKKYHVSRNLCLVSQSNSITYSTFNNYTISNNAVTSTGQALLGFKCKVEPNTSYTISIKKNASVDLRIREYSSEPSDWQTDFIIQSLNTNQTTATFTTSQDTTWVLVAFWFSAEGHTAYDIMLNSGSTALPYEPYSSEVWHDIPYYIHNTSTDTITTLPADIYPTGTTATVGLKGNEEHTGTPTPDNPIMPQGTGERTGNLADITTFQDNMSLDATTGLPISTGNSRIANVTPIDVTSNATVKVTFVYSGQLTGVRFMYSIFNNGALIERVANKINGDTINVQNADKLYICIYVVTKEEISNLMVSEGSGSVPYEPYGIKIPISSANTTTNIYLGEVESTRKIRKYEFTGQENWSYTSTGRVYMTMTNQMRFISPICTHYKGVAVTGYAALNDGEITVSINNQLTVYDTARPTAEDFKAYLAQQYTNGTPVTVWYVLATETTGIVNEPLRKIGNYADEVSGITIPTIAGANTISVDTTLQPSEVTVNYKGWHPVADVHKRESGAWT